MFKKLFGLGKKAPEHTVRCAMCNIELSMTIESMDNTSPYEYDKDVQKISDIDCPYCKTNLAIILSSEGEYETRDIKWDVEMEKYGEAEEKLENQVSDLEDIIDDEDSTEKEIANAKKKIEPIQAKIEKLHSAFEKKEEKYEERRNRWQEKGENKYGDKF